jgi:hypothetical protein
MACVFFLAEGCPFDDSLAFLASEDTAITPLLLVEARSAVMSLAARRLLDALTAAATSSSCC